MKIKRKLAAVTLLLLVVPLVACAQAPETLPGGALENGIAAIEDAMTIQSEKSKTSSNPEDDLRTGSSQDTVATPADFPQEYNYGTGRIRDYSRSAMLQKLPMPTGNETVLNTLADPTRIQVLYLWEEGNVPSKNQFTQSMTGYFDDWNFRPYVTAIPVAGVDFYTEQGMIA